MDATYTFDKPFWQKSDILQRSCLRYPYKLLYSVCFIFTTLYIAYIANYSPLGTGRAIISATMADWDKLGTSGDVDDRRGGGAQLALGGGILALVVTGAMMYFSGASGGQIATTLLEQILAGQSGTSQVATVTDPEYKQFASEVLGSTTKYWTAEFRQRGESYKAPAFVLFRGATNTGCGLGSASVGPFYCPDDQTVYLDETFFDQIKSQLNANTGDVAQAYVIAHEVGHHVQQTGRDFPHESKSIQIELQADCYAGAWASSVKGIFESPDEIDEALDLASDIGDDTIQQKTEGQINQEIWTHGSSAERHDWFKKGYDSGDPSICTP